VTYPNDQVKQELSNWALLRVDIAEHHEVAELFEVVGIPLAVAITATGEELGRVENFVEPGEFRARLGRLRSRSAADEPKTVKSAALGAASSVVRYFFRFFPHRAAAAFFAASRNFLLPSFLARAGPPFLPPKRPRATAAGFLPASGSGSGGALPVARSTMALPSWLMSRGSFLRERFCMPTLC
jgi:hypothetical protein